MAVKEWKMRFAQAPGRESEGSGRMMRCWDGDVLLLRDANDMFGGDVHRSSVHSTLESSRP